MSTMISFGSGRSSKAVAVSTPIAENTVAMTGISGAVRTLEPLTGKTSAAKTTVYAEFIVASHAVAHGADATETHSKSTDGHKILKSVSPSTLLKSPQDDTTATVSSGTKKPKELKRGMAELLEAEQTIKQSLDGLVESMRGLTCIVMQHALELNCFTHL